MNPLVKRQSGDVENNIEHGHVEDHQVKSKRESHGHEKVNVDPWGHDEQRLVLRHGVKGIGHLDDVEDRGVEGEGSGGKTVSHQVDPQKLDGDHSLGKAEGGGKEDADNLSDVGGNQVADELLHVGVDSAALLDGGDNGGEVIVSKDHLRGGLGHSGSGAHGDTNLGSLEGGGVIDTVTSHGGDLLLLLQVLDNLGLVEGLNAGEHPGVGGGSLLFADGGGIELTARVGLTVSALVLLEDSNPLADGLGGVLVVSGDHDDADTGLLAENNGGGDLHPGGVKHTNNTAEGEVDLVLGELGGVIKAHLGWVHGRVSGGEAEAPEGVTASSPM